MKSPSAKIVGLLLASVAFAAAPAAGAETFVPPENSAAVQYTEAFPTAGGDREADKADSRSGGTLDAKKVKRLNEQGPAGRAVTEIVMTTAPGAVDAGKSGNPDSEGKRDRLQEGNGVNRDAGAVPGEVVDRSGLNEAIKQAMGYSTTGELGAVFPLLIVAAFVGSIALLRRRRNEG